jgi:hypothetical protein
LVRLKDGSIEFILLSYWFIVLKSMLYTQKNTRSFPEAPLSFYGPLIPEENEDFNPSNISITSVTISLGSMASFLYLSAKPRRISIVKSEPPSDLAPLLF